ncbi:LysR family transcriptional regulator [Desulfospira joergensenii]|uniref:LysR family transcriptional regulator n=1 Tax=Desulfospira joergensenii TaxID=53329 RepID=UPI0003B52EAE|nr:LysR family transcriptional regulator [Desulfospira joergensenii]
MLMIPDLNRVKIFYHVFHIGSAAGAAKELNISPSAVSQALAKLESEVKARLFTRLHRRLVPTSAGKSLFSIVSPFIRELATGMEGIRQSRKVPSGMLKIGAPKEFGKNYFPGMFALFRKTYPAVVFTLTLAGPAEILSMISGGEIDFGLVDIFLTREPVFGDLSRYSMEPLVDEEVCLACSGTYYRQAIKEDHSFENLVQKEFISYQSSSLPLKSWFKHHFNRFPANLNRVMTVDSLQTVINGIKNHLGLGVVAAHMVREDIEDGSIVPVGTSREDVINTIALVQLQEKIPTLTEKTFIRYMKEDIKSSGCFETFLDTGFRP